MTTYKHCAFIIALILSFATSLSATASESLFQPCTTCHGDKAQGNEALKAPALAQQQSWYLKQQLIAFKKGYRGKHPSDTLGQQMVPFVQALSNEDQESLVTYITNQNPPQNSTDSSLKKMKGYSAYQARCGACHGDNAQGNAAFKAPKLTGLSLAYLSRQMEAFKADIRGYEAEDKLGRQMAMMAKTVSAEELQHILTYISQ